MSFYGDYGPTTQPFHFLPTGIGSPPAVLDPTKFYVDKTVSPAVMYLVDTTVTPHALVHIA